MQIFLEYEAPQAEIVSIHATSTILADSASGVIDDINWEE